MHCCSCSCNHKDNALSRINSCYPSGDQSEPISSRLKKLDQWIDYDSTRFSTIPDILLDKVKFDTNNEKINSAKVGMRILSHLLQNIKEANLEISQTMTTLIVFLINTRKSSFLLIANESLFALAKFTKKSYLKNSVSNITHTYANIVDDIELKPIVLKSLANLIEQSTDDIIPIEIILPIVSNEMAYSKQQDEDSVHRIIVAIAHNLTLVYLPQFSEKWLTFIETNHMWNDDLFIKNFMLILCCEMNERCASQFFKAWLNQLPPRTADNGNCRTVISVAVFLLEIDKNQNEDYSYEIENDTELSISSYSNNNDSKIKGKRKNKGKSSKKSKETKIETNNENKDSSLIEKYQSLPSKLLSQTELDDILMILFKFILQLPDLMYEDRNVILGDALLLSEKVSTRIGQFEISKIVHTQIWLAIPIGINKKERINIDDSDHDNCNDRNSDDSDDYFKKIPLIFRFNTMFSVSIGLSLTKKMINESLKRIFFFIINFISWQSPDVLSAIIIYLRTVENNLQTSASSECVIPFLLALQKALKSIFLSKSQKTTVNDSSEKSKKDKFDVFYTTTKISANVNVKLHTFIMCAMVDACRNCPQDAKDYVIEVSKNRIESSYPLFDCSLPFFKDYFPENEIDNNYSKSKTKKKRTSSSLSSMKGESISSFFTEGTFPYFKKKILLGKIFSGNSQKIELVEKTINDIPKLNKTFYNENDDNESDLSL